MPGKLRLQAATVNCMANCELYTATIYGTSKTALVYGAYGYGDSQLLSQFTAAVYSGSLPFRSNIRRLP